MAVDQATISLHGAHLLARERAARAAAEAAHRQLAFLAESSTQRVADLAVPTLADACFVDIVVAAVRT